MFSRCFSLTFCIFFWLAPFLFAEPLPGTKPLTRDGDLAAQMVAGIDKYLMRELAGSVEKRKAYWKPDYSSAKAHQQSVRPNRERLKKIIGIVDERLPPKLEFVGGPGEPALVAEAEGFKVYAVRWAVLPGVDAEGLLFEPNSDPGANIIVKKGSGVSRPLLSFSRSWSLLAPFHAQPQLLRRYSDRFC